MESNRKILKDEIIKQRELLKANFNVLKDIESDQDKGLPYPPLDKPLADGEQLIELPQVDKEKFMDVSLVDAIMNRVSRRKFADKQLSLDELAFLLYATQGVRGFRKDKFSFRTVPSGGARQPFETYLTVFDVDGLKSGLYRYLPFQHALAFMGEIEALSEKMIELCLGQKFCGKSAVTFIWTCIPYRTEWRYDIASHKTILLDAGHLCQNLYLACEAIDCGTCAIGAYAQDGIDELLGVDGIDEYTIYLAPVGKKVE